MQGERIVLRAIEKEDLPDLRQWYNDYEMRGVYMGGYQPMPAEQFEKEKFIKTDEKRKVLAITSKETGELLGTVSYYKEEFNSAQIGIVIGDKEHRRSGYGAEAIKLLMRICILEENFQKLTLWTGGWNVAAQKHAENLGFKQAFRIRKNFIRNDEWQDSCCYDMLREEYLEMYCID